MNLDLLKHPILIGILSAVATYFYLSWDAERMYKKNPNIPKKKINFITPAVIGVIVWFLASCYFDADVKSIDLNNVTNIPKYKIADTLHKTSESYHLIGRNNIKLPQTDVLIDLAHF